MTIIDETFPIMETTQLAEQQFTDPTYLIIGLLLSICIMLTICGYMFYHNVQQQLHPKQEQNITPKKEQSPSSKLVNNIEQDEEKYIKTHQTDTNINNNDPNILTHLTEEAFDPHHITENIIIKYYDSTVIIISILGMLFDFIILTHFISNSLTSYSIISIFIFIISHISYVCVYTNYLELIESKLSLTIYSIILFICSPILPSLLYLIRAKQLNVCCFLQAYNCCDFIPCCIFEQDSIEIDRHDGLCEDEDLSISSRWNKHSYIKHIGYIMQALLQSFPCSLLQIVYFSRMTLYDNSIENVQFITILLHISILVSFISICIKSMIFVQTLNHNSRIFFWLCFTTDLLIFYSVFYSLINMEHNVEIIKAGVIILILCIIALSVPFILCIMFGFVLTRYHIHDQVFGVVNVVYIFKYIVQSLLLVVLLMLSLTSWLAVYIYYYSFHRIRAYSKYNYIFWNRIIDKIESIGDKNDLEYIKKVNVIIIDNKYYFQLKRYDDFIDTRQGFFHFMLTVIVGFIVHKQKYPNCSWMVKILGMMYITSKIMIVAYVPLLLDIAYDTNQMIYVGILSGCALLFLICLLYGQFCTRGRFRIVKKLMPGYYVDVMPEEIPIDNVSMLNNIVDEFVNI
eukprot:290254_1